MVGLVMLTRGKLATLPIFGEGNTDRFHFKRAIWQESRPRTGQHRARYQASRRIAMETGDG